MYHGNPTGSLMGNGSAAQASDGGHYASDYHHLQQQQQQGEQHQQHQQQGTQHTMANGMHHGPAPPAGGGTHHSNGIQQNNNNSNAHHNHNSPSAPLIYPALHLQPLNDTFAPKQISLSPPGPQNKIKIGRQTNNKTIPQPSNGYFDSKVLSRMHAEVWSQDGKVYIKDVKSSNGTFINSARLSPEGQESEIFELHNDDVVEFGIDIVGDDNKTIIHHKVACRVFLVMTAEEALGLRHDFAALYRGGIAGSTLNHHSVGPGAEGGLRRSKLGSISGYGQNGGSNGFMSFDHVIHRLQAELQKSRDTAGELGTLNAAMHDIGETLGGGLPPMQNPPYQHMVPSSNGETTTAGGSAGAGAAATPSSVAEIKALEEQVKETQKSLIAHMERLVGLESRIEEHDTVKGEVFEMRHQVEETRKELAEAMRQRETALTSSNMQKLSADSALRDIGTANGTGEGEENDFDDGASMVSAATVTVDNADQKVGKGPVGVDEVESADVVGQLSTRESEEDDEGLTAHDAEVLSRLRAHVGPLAPPDSPDKAADSVREEDTEARQRNEELSKRLEAMESQLERALGLGRTLAGQHAEATETVRKLEERVKSLESEQLRLDGTTTELKDSVTKVTDAASNVARGTTVESSEASIVAEAAAGGVAAQGILGMVESKWGTWRDAFESDFQKDKAALLAEREELRRIVLAWDSLNQDIEDVVETATSSSSSVAGEDPAQRERAASASSVRSNSSSVASTNAGGSNGRKKKKKNKGNNNVAQQAASNRAAAGGIVGSGPARPAAPTEDTAVRLNRELRALLYTDEFNVLVRDTHATASALSVSRASAALATGRSTKEVENHSAADTGEHKTDPSPRLDLLRSASGLPERDDGGSSSGVAKGSGSGSDSKSAATAPTPQELREGLRKRVVTNMAQRKKRGTGRWGDASVHSFDNVSDI